MPQSVTGVIFVRVWAVICPCVYECVCVCVCECLCVCAYACVCLYVSVCLFVCLSASLCLSVYVCVCVYIYIYTYTHTHTHTHTEYTCYKRGHNSDVNICVCTMVLTYLWGTCFVCLDIQMIKFSSVPRFLLHLVYVLENIIINIVICQTHK